MTLSTKLVFLAVLGLLQIGCGGESTIAPNKVNISLEKETPLTTAGKQSGENQKR